MCARIVDDGVEQQDNHPLAVGRIDIDNFPEFHIRSVEGGYRVDTIDGSLMFKR